MSDNNVQVRDVGTTEVTECWPHEPNIKAMYHEAGVLNEDETCMSCSSCGGVWPV